MLVFGYGSLMSLESLQATVPVARDPRPAFVNGFRRVFNLWDEQGYTETNLDVGGVPFCALNAVSHPGGRINGVVFEVGGDYFDALCEREHDYNLEETAAFSFKDRKKLGTCALFSAPVTVGSYQFGLPAQERYLQISAAGALGHGRRFYREFLANTFIGEAALDEIPKLFEPDGALGAAVYSTPYFQKHGIVA